MLRQEWRQARVIISTAWQRNLNFRFTTLTYRVGEIVEVLVLILLWTSIYETSGGIIKGFTLNEMITYVLIGNLCAAAARNFLPPFISRDINEGRLSTFLVKPISYIKYIFLNEFGRAFLATAVSFLSQVVITLFFLDRVVVNSDWRYVTLVIVMTFFAVVVELLIGFLIGIIAFWTEEVDGLQYSLDRVRRFFSGGYFPLSLLPPVFLAMSTYLPFQYSFYAPATLYLRKMTLAEGVEGLLVQSAWIIILSLLLAFVWNRGLRRYEATGS
jgi:ABC-2 type transport system permease protein